MAANLQRVARQPNMPDRAGAGELHGAGCPHVIEDSPGAPGPVDTGERKDLAGDESARFLGSHRPRQGGCEHGAGGDGTQQETPKHAATPTRPQRKQSPISLRDAYHTNRGNIGAGWLVKSERPQGIFTTVRPRTWPARIFTAMEGT